MPDRQDVCSWSMQTVRPDLNPPIPFADEAEVWDVPQAIEYMHKLEPLRPWFIEEPTAPDDAVGHAAIRKALKPLHIGVATGEHAHNRVLPSSYIRHGFR